MSSEYRNIYQIARESAGFTQEKAAELLDISVESIRAYEGSRRVPPDKTVIKMIEIYGTQYLAYQHLKTSAEVGQIYMPNVVLKDLPSAILCLHKEVTDFLKCKDELIEIGCDGMITEEELPAYEKIMRVLEAVAEAILTLKFAVVKK